MLRQLLFVAALALALACVGCDARATFADKIVESVQQQRLAVFYPLGARFELVASSALAGNDTDNPTSTDLGWEGWLALSIVTLVFVVTGLVFCFMGYKLFKLIVALIGFFGGFILGVLLTLTVAGWAIDVPFSNGGSDWQIAEWVALGVGILFGVILALCSWWFYMVGIFLVGGGVGLVLAFYIYVVGYTHLTDPSWLAETLGWITAVVLFIVLGFLAMKLQKFMIILGSAAIGGFLVLLGPYTMIAVAVDLTKYQWVDWLFVVGLAFFWVAGVLVQYRFTALEDWHEETYNIERRSFV